MDKQGSTTTTIMNAQDLYNNVLHFSDDDFSPKPSGAVSQHGTFSTPRKQLSFSPTTSDRTQFTPCDPTELSNCSFPDNHGSKCGLSVRGSVSTPPHHKVTSKLMQNHSVAPYFLFSQSSSNVGPLKRIENVMNMDVDSPPLKKKSKVMLPCQKHVFSSQDCTSDVNSSPHDAGQFESCKKTTTATATASLFAQAEGQRPYKGFPSPTFDENDLVMKEEFTDELIHQDKELQGFSPGLPHVGKLCTPIRPLSCLPVRHHHSMVNTTPTFSQVHVPLPAKEDVIIIEQSHSELGTSTMETELGELEAISSSFDPKINSYSSETHATIMRALSKSENEQYLTGDFSKPLLLPILEIRKHSDLWSISVDTLADVIKGKYNDELASCRIIDCRFPYEYDGGHINGAELWHLPKLVHEQLETKKKAPFIASNEELRHILVFHCEFSCKRGPRTQRLLRQIDRAANKERYPFLHFPEIYLLEGGYMAFFKKHSELCTPCNYVKMLDPKYKEDLKNFMRSKSWDNGKKAKSSLFFPMLEKP